MNEYNTSGRTEDQPDSIRGRVPKGRSQWGWVQWIHGWLGKNEWRRRERHLAEQERGYRLHLGGVLIRSNARLD